MPPPANRQQPPAITAATEEGEEVEQRPLLPSSLSTANAGPPRVIMLPDWRKNREVRERRRREREREREKGGENEILNKTNLYTRKILFFFSVC